MSDGTGGRDLSIQVEQLAVLNWLGEVGVTGVNERLEGFVSGNVSVISERATSGYLSPETTEVQFDADNRVGARVQLRDRPAGYMLVLFPPASANRATALLLRDAVDDLSTVSMDMARDALLELCNMIANGFLDEWADLVESEIGVTTPQFVSNTEREIMRSMATRHDDVGLYITTRLRLSDQDVVASLYVFPTQEEFVESVNGIDLGVIRQ